MFRSRLRLILFLCLCLLVLLSLQTRNIYRWTHKFQPVSAAQLPAIISLASSHHRLDNELPITLRSLVAQSIHPAEIRVYFPEADRSIVESRRQMNTSSEGVANSSSLTEVFRHPLVSLIFTEDVGPATKFVPVLKELLERAFAGHVEALDQPVIIVDDDHYYTPLLVGTLLNEHKTTPKASVGLRGWRVREDLNWGVSSDEVDRHVIHGYRLNEPYRVGVLTANEGYLVTPRYFLQTTSDSLHSSFISASPLLNTTDMARTRARLVDDIWMAGSLCAQSIPRIVVPLPGAPSVDVTATHTLEGHMAAAKTDRGTANNDALKFFADAWRAEGLWYRFAADVLGAKGIVTNQKADEPVFIGPMSRSWKEFGHWWRERLVRLGVW